MSFHSRFQPAAITLALVALLGSPTVLAQQTALTPEQMASARREVPELVTLMGLRPGMSVADVGAGFGAWTVEFAKALGPSGRVFATDLGAAQLASLRSYPAREGVTNVTVIEGSVTSANLPAACCDAILVRDAFHHFTDPAAMIKSLVAALKPGGRLALVDFPPRPGTAVPAGVPADRAGHGVPIAVVERELGAALTHVRTIPTWSPASQPADLFLVLFSKP
jgi:ubiquinone/menaquinone biosynthesis C-methylase UbiE